VPSRTRHMASCRAEAIMFIRWRPRMSSTDTSILFPAFTRPGPRGGHRRKGARNARCDGPLSTTAAIAGGSPLLACFLFLP